MTLKNRAIGVLLLLAISLSCWSIIASHPLHKNVFQNDPKTADAIMEDVIATVYNKLGEPSFKLTTPKMVHYPENDSTDITTPRVTLFRQSPQPWHIDADYAKTKNGITEILFWQNVNIHHAADTENPNTSLLTDALTIFPDQQIVKTDQPVVFTQPETTIHAVGMLADLNDNTIKLLSQTQGEYAPTS